MQKYQAAATQEAKFEFLRAFLLDPTSLASIEIEAEYVEASKHDDSSNWEASTLYATKDLHK